jgi:nicotinamide mononucleotide transporter
VTVPDVLPGLAGVLAALDPLEVAGAALGLAYVVLAIRQHRACWALSLASAALYIGVFWGKHLYLQALLQAYYVAVSVYGWRAWSGASGQAGLAVSRTAGRRQGLAILAVVGTSLATARILAVETGSTDPMLDALTTCASLWATWLVARKRIDNWIWWIVVDALIALLCWRQQLFASMILYLCYVGLAIVGWKSWRRDLGRADEGRA